MVLAQLDAMSDIVCEHSWPCVLFLTVTHKPLIINGALVCIHIRGVGTVGHQQLSIIVPCSEPHAIASDSLRLILDSQHFKMKDVHLSILSVGIKDREMCHIDIVSL